MTLAAAAAVAGLWLASPAAAVQILFLPPGEWTVGAHGTTRQEWDVFRGRTTPPDVALIRNPAITTIPSLTVHRPGFLSGSANFYAFSGDYSVSADIFNHGGPSGSFTPPAGWGTHLMIQTSSTLNGAHGVLSDTLAVVDLAGNPLAGGAATERLRHCVLFEGEFDTAFGIVDRREEIWEFFLPGHVGDFRITTGVRIHSMFDHLRVDTALAPSAFPVTPIPEPSALGVLAAGGLLLRRRRRA